MPSPRDAHKALRLLKSAASKSVPHNAFLRAVATSTRAGLGQHIQSGTPPRADGTAENGPNGPSKPSNDEEKVPNKVERLIALSQNHAHASASPVVEPLKDTGLDVEIAEKALPRKRLRIRRYASLRPDAPVEANETQSSTGDVEAKTPNPKAPAHRLVRRHRDLGKDTRTPLRKFERLEVAQPHETKTIEIKYEGTAIRYHGVKKQSVGGQGQEAKEVYGQNSAKAQDNSKKREQDTLHFRSHPPADGPRQMRKVVRWTYPKLDLFLIEDFQPVLTMMCDATPNIPIKRDSAEVYMENESWQDSESDSNFIMDGVGDLMDDITYAPMSETAPIWASWTGDQPFALGGEHSTSDPTLQAGPKQWTQESLADHLGSLLASAARAAERYPTGIAANNYRLAATEEVTNLLMDEQLAPHITPQVLNMALFHLCREKAYEDVLRIYRHLKRNSFPFRSNDFNTVLFAAAWEERSSYFKPVLEHMLKSGFPPTGQTWFTFYKLVWRKSTEEMANLRFVMRRKGLLQGGETVKQALTAALGWMDEFELDIRPPRTKKRRSHLS